MVKMAQEAESRLFDSRIFDNISVKILMCRFNQCLPDWGEVNCRYTYNKFYYIMDGEGEIIIGDDHFRLQPEELYLIPANTAHTYRHNPAKPVIKYWCHFHLSLGADQALVYNRDTLRCQVPGKQGIPAFRQLIQAADTGNQLDVLTQNAALLSLLRIFLGIVDLAAILPVPENDIAHQLKYFISKNIQSKITLSQLAAVAHLHPNYLVKYFRKYFAETPIDYINNQRLQLATRQLIKNPAQPIKNIVKDVGFSDYHYFTRLFKRKYGVTPSDYRSTGQAGLEGA